MQSAIRVENLSKEYRLGLTHVRSLNEAAARWTRRLRGLSPTLEIDEEQQSSRGVQKQFWALQDLNFEVRPGEVVGVIGRNGAGKSTLLKILSRITKPTTGCVDLRGRVGSLLEVGTGFHPELTGRENVYMNGTLLGMTKREVDRRFDEIMEFAGVHKFVDTPVKRYSSGMKVRLGFAVAAHLEPEIMIVDEVLAVGDAEFQKKCLGKMRDVAASGRTVLFVSHNIAAVENLCQRGIVLERGRIVEDSDTTQAITRYCELISQKLEQPLAHRTDRNGTGELRLTSVKLVNSLAESANVIGMGDDWVLKFEFNGTGHVVRPQIGFVVTTLSGQRIARILTAETHGDLPSFRQASSAQVQLKNVNLVPGSYSIIVDLSDQLSGTVDRVEHALTIEVVPQDVYGRGKISDSQRSAVFCYFDCEWTCIATEEATLA